MLFKSVAVLLALTASFVAAAPNPATATLVDAPTPVAAALAKRTTYVSPQLIHSDTNTSAATSAKVLSSYKKEELAPADRRTPTRPSSQPSATSGCWASLQDPSAVAWYKSPTLEAMMELEEKATQS